MGWDGRERPTRPRGRQQQQRTDTAAPCTEPLSPIRTPLLGSFLPFHLLPLLLPPFLHDFPSLLLGTQGTRSCLSFAFSSHLSASCSNLLPSLSSCIWGRYVPPSHPTLYAANPHCCFSAHSPLSKSRNATGKPKRRRKKKKKRGRAHMQHQHLSLLHLANYQGRGRMIFSSRRIFFSLPVYLYLGQWINILYKRVAGWLNLPLVGSPQGKKVTGQVRT
ncbi:uncharacterized protein BDZ83DRAFT_150882 [Colletotrichum acutatum]|uniref:Uncharacterized protein n=1 Tax=Glomerella acutata TaxID=27357 RepID=A0AAD8URH8_GLOAC|nr:uncharacterized protein BDZ83DRAFT_150882 [Colletotrichum acutatum]KAK1728133.1 hypothetical protein BDZ83DRAFT_150882 [Colletotrichum acutatum]